MAESCYRTGQAAKLLGVSSYHIRRLCEAGQIAAELSNGQQWKIPATEIGRLRKEGVPPVPQDLVEEEEPEETTVNEGGEVPEGLYAEPSDEVIEAAEEVKIVESRLRKRRLEREVEETEDWFRARTRQQAAEEAAERRHAETERAVQRREQWRHKWVEYALDSLPLHAPSEIRLDVHAAVEQALASLDDRQPEHLTRRLTDAAVCKALLPWNRQEHIQNAVESAMRKLPAEVNYGWENADLKQRALEAARTAASRLPQDATHNEMEMVASQAVQPMIRESQHRQTCRRLVSSLYVTDALWQEQQEAKQALEKALAAVPIGATDKQFRDAQEIALAPLAARIAQRKEAAEQERMRRAAEWRVDLELGHIERYLQTEYEFDGGYSEMRRETERLRKVIGPILIRELVRDTNMSSQDIRDRIEELVEEHT